MAFVKNSSKPQSKRTLGTISSIPVFVTPKTDARKVHLETDVHKGDFETDTRNKMGYFDGGKNQTFGQRMCTRYGANLICAQPTCRMHALATPFVREGRHWVQK